MRILITGSRNWTDENFIRKVLHSKQSSEPITLISGAAKGADAICEKIAHELGWKVERYPADWNKWGTRAGYIRNSFMVNECSPDLCIGFVLNDSKGALMTIGLSHNAGIITEVYSEYI